MTVVVHHLEQSRSQRILWLLEELGVQYDIKLYKRNSETMLAPPELLEIHPLGKSPVITDGSITVAESGALDGQLPEQAFTACRFLDRPCQMPQFSILLYSPVVNYWFPALLEDLLAIPGVWAGLSA